MRKESKLQHERRVHQHKMHLKFAVAIGCTLVIVCINGHDVFTLFREFSTATCVGVLAEIILS